MKTTLCGVERERSLRGHSVLIQVVFGIIKEIKMPDTLIWSHLILPADPILSPLPLVSSTVYAPVCLRVCLCVNARLHACMWTCVPTCVCARLPACVREAVPEWNIIVWDLVDDPWSVLFSYAFLDRSLCFFLSSFLSDREGEKDISDGFLFSMCPYTHNLW